MKTAHPYSNLTKFIVNTIDDINFFLFNTDEKKYLSSNQMLDKINLTDLILVIESNVRKLEATMKYLQGMRKLAPQSEYEEYCQAITETIEDIHRLEALIDDVKALHLLKSLF